MEEKENTTPQWIEDMKKWQEENKELRSIFLIATDGENSNAVCCGSSLMAKDAMVASILDDGDCFKRIIKDALECSENPILRIALIDACEKYLIKHGYIEDDACEEESAPPEIKEALKTILSKIAYNL